MPHIDIKCFPRELQIQPESWQAIWDAEIAPQMETLIKKPGYSM